jgi:hypothetical protein
MSHFKNKTLKVYFLLLAEIHFVDFTNIREHVTNVVITLVDLLVCAHPMRLMHAYQPIALGLCYSAFTAVYYAFGGTNRLGFSYIYAILNWDFPTRAAIVTFFTLTFEIFIFFIMWCLHLLRLKVASAYDFYDSKVLNKGQSVKMTV